MIITIIRCLPILITNKYQSVIEKSNCNRNDYFNRANSQLVIEFVISTL